MVAWTSAMSRKRGIGGLVLSLGGIAALAAGLLVILKKGPIGGLLFLLVIAVIWTIATVASAFANRKKGNG